MLDNRMFRMDKKQLTEMDINTKSNELVPLYSKLKEPLYLNQHTLLLLTDTLVQEART
jgi:hypothetical protein